MNDQTHPLCSAFAGNRRIASGDINAVALATKEIVDGGETDPVLIFDDATGRLVELDLRGTSEEVAARLGPSRSDFPASSGAAAPSHRGPGRPKLGVVSKEVTLLPRHWAWLGAQRGSASATLRRLVDEARRSNEQRDQVRHAQDTAYRFMTAMVGDQPGFEEAIRALYARDRTRFEGQSQGWPPDLKHHSRKLAADAFGEVGSPSTMSS